jgi:hypothetical protein
MIGFCMAEYEFVDLVHNRPIWGHFFEFGLSRIINDHYAKLESVRDMIHSEAL